MTVLGDSSDGAPLGLSRELDALCDEFERSLRAGIVPELASFLDRIVPAGRRLLLDEMVPLALDHYSRLAVADPLEKLVELNLNLEEAILSAAAHLSDEKATALYEPPVGPVLQPHPSSRRKASRGLQIRCPHCSNHIELIGDTPTDSIDCTVCGSNFSLVDRSKETRMAEALQKIGRFELVARLGVGGFGTVWKARDTQLDRAVALKIPRHGQLTSDELESFFREARSVAQLRHPNIVTVHDVDREGDAVYIVSDLIRGVSLADLLTSRQLTPRESATLLIPIVDALEHAHRKGVVHRDLKPRNVMIDDDGTPYLMDFGLAKRETDAVTMTTDGQVLGTPAYMSPEQASGRSAWADRRTDVYSLGVVLFELLTGELPFRGNAQMQVHSRIHQDAPNASTLNRHLPIDVATICAKCLEREPGRRYQSAAEVSDELRRFLDKLPIRARPLSPIGKAARWVERQPLQAAFVGLTAFLAVAGPATALLINQQRLQLKRKYAENANLIIQREQESRDAIAQVADLQSQLDTWEGRSNPYDFWPPSRDNSPLRQQMRSLLTERGRALDIPSDNDLENACRLLCLAMLNEGVNHPDDARRCFEEAIGALRRLQANRGYETEVDLALADAYERLAALTFNSDREKSIAWQEKAVQLRRSLYDRRPDDARVASLLLDSQMRSGLAAGYDKGGEKLKEVHKLDAQLRGRWAASPIELYQLACMFAGRQDWLRALAVEGPADAVKEPRR